MIIEWDAIKALEIHLYTGTLPPPYRHEIKAKFQARPTGWQVTFSLNYLDREDLTEEDLFEEGFTGEDDFSWEGGLPNAWVAHLKEALSKTTFPKDQKTATKQEPQVRLKVHLLAGGEQQAMPSEAGFWEYLLQELMQAVYELAGIERSLEVAYREVRKGEPIKQVDLRASFASREAVVVVSEDETAQSEKTIDWSEIKECLRSIYQYEFDVLRAKPKPPQKRGKYLFLGEGGWLPIPEALMATGKEEPTADAIKGWFSRWM